ncbi:hypothetical protein BGZ63DRAFT_516478 [Mariannaea sp. PMI_226]|nr:hypothetical protein BGZ63DRAFT_516478 [Mariannaea sp. PMI_226]
MILSSRYLAKRSAAILVAILISLAALVYLYLYQSQSEVTSFSTLRHNKTSSHNLLDDISNSTFGFEKIFVIGLPERSDRRDRITLQAALSDIEFEFVDGVLGKNVPDKVIPGTSKHDRLDDGSLGCWRAHMNAIREIVHRNLSSALIMEDDADWDVRIKSQLRDFALSTHALIQPLADAPPGSYADPTFLNPAEHMEDPVPEIPFDNLPATIPPVTSPYGDDWDLLWLGHCGMLFPWPGNPNLPKGRVIHLNDETVAQKQYLYSVTPPFTLVDDYPHHTRAVNHVQDGVCTLGYAVSQRGARKLLHDVGLMDLERPIDILLAYFCTGDHGRSFHTCLGIQPGIFQHHRAAGPINASSDIGDHGAGFREKSNTDMIRWSVLLNADEILNGGTNFSDQLPDDKKKEEKKVKEKTKAEKGKEEKKGKEGKTEEGKKEEGGKEEKEDKKPAASKGDR